MLMPRDSSSGEARFREHDQVFRTAVPRVKRQNEGSGSRRGSCGSVASSFTLLLLEYEGRCTVATDCFSELLEGLQSGNTARSQQFEEIDSLSARLILSCFVFSAVRSPPGASGHGYIVIGTMFVRQ